ncbi:MAG: hypothetical protein HFH45_00020 [Bacilli bacterium]|nr:hypothetical protein [Bacilli bacterium]
MIFFFISLSTYLCYLILKYQRQLKILQDNNFDMKLFGDYITKNPRETFVTPEILGFVIIIMALFADAKIVGICMVGFYTLLFLAELRDFKKVNFNSDSIKTIIFIMILYVLLFLVFGLCNQYLSESIWICYAIVIGLSYLSSIVILILGKLVTLVSSKKH